MEPEHSSPLRILAPAALVCFALAAILVIATTSGSEGGDSRQSTRLEQQDLGAQKRSERAQRQAAAALRRGTYTVKRDDTLGSISEKTGVPVDRLMQLNPDADPQSLQAGQKIKLR
jgi:LysM repeat protein